MDGGLEISIWIVLGTIGGIGLLGNTIIFITLRLEPNKISVIYWLMCLAIVDFGCLIFLPMAAVSWQCGVDFSNTTCTNDQRALLATSETIQSIFYTVTSFVVFGAAVDRYIAIAQQQSSRSLLTKNKALVTIVIIALLAIAIHIPRFICIKGRNQVTNCMVPSGDNTTTDTASSEADNAQREGICSGVYQWVMFAVTQVCPMICLMLSLVVISCHYVRSNRRLAQQRYTRKKYIANLSFTSVLIAILVVHVLFSVFSLAYNVLVDMMGCYMSTEKPRVNLFVANIVLLCVKASGNFFIFLALDKKFRANACDFLACKCKEGH